MRSFSFSFLKKRKQMKDDPAMMEVLSGDVAPGSSHPHKNGVNHSMRKLSLVDELTNPPVFEETDNYISALPTELMLEIFRFLCGSELGTLALVCKEFNTLSKDDFLWRQVFRRRWKNDYLPNKIDSWKAIVKQRAATLERWKKGKPKHVKSLTSTDTNRVWSVQLDDDKIISGSTSTVLQVWDLHGDLDKPTNLRGHTAEVRCHHFIKDHLVSGGYDTTVRIWDLKEGQCLRVLPHKADVYAVQFDQGKVVSCTRDSLIRQWDFETGALLANIKGHSLCLRTVRFDENIIMSGGEDKTAKVWDARTYECLATLEGHKNGLTSLQFDDDKIVTGSFDASVKIWDRRNFRCYMTMQPKKTPSLSTRYYYHSPLSVWQLQFDEDKLATAHADHCVKIWNLNDGTELATLKGHTGEVISLHFDSTRLVTGSEDRSLRLWDFGRS